MNKLSQSQIDSLIVSQAKNHLIDYCIATNEKYKPNWHHEVIASSLENIAENGDRDFKILIIQMPPRHGKSELATINFPSWYLGNYPDKEIITASYSADLAQDFGRKTREVVSSPAFHKIFNIDLKEDEQSKAKWRTNKGGSYTSVGVGGATTGRGANIFIIDDPIKNREEAESLVYREKVWYWFTSTAFTRLEPKGVMVVILTRWHLDDLAGRILANEEMQKFTKVISFPAIATEKEPLREAGEALWPERFPIAELERTKSFIGPYDFSALYQQSPILSEKQEFKPEWIKKATEQDLEHKTIRRFLTVDTALSKSANSDYTGFCDNSVDQENFWYLRAWRQAVSPKELIDMLFTLHQKNNYEKIGIERTIYYEGIAPFLEDEMRKRNAFLPVVELSHNHSHKDIRIRGLVPRYASGSIFHIACKDLEEEMFMFPFGVHDDVIDATAYQLQVAEQAYAAVDNDEFALYSNSYS